MALLLHLKGRTKSTTLTNTYLFHRRFSTSNTGGDGGDQASPDSDSPFSSYFKEVKDSLKQNSPSPSAPRLSNPRSSNFSFQASSNSQQTSIDEIRRNLSAFRRRTTVPPPGDPLSPSSTSQQLISFQDIYKRNMLQEQGESTRNDADFGPAKPGGGGQLSFDAIRESLRQHGSAGDRKGVDRMSLTGLKDALKLKPTDSSVIGGTGALPESIFGREMRERKEGGSRSDLMKTEFVKMYGYEDLGEKLKKLRPERKGKEWFSLRELNERLTRLREMEEKESEFKTKGVGVFKELREVLVLLSDDMDKPKKNPRR